MPGAPNRPPETPAPPPPSPTDDHMKRVLRRLTPSRIALSLDLWKGAPSPELLAPLESAEAAYAHGDWRESEGRLDALSVRFAEPRWPTLPAPFRELRVAIPPPQPPQWDPEFTLTLPEKEARKARRWLTTQLALARASVEWAQKKGIDVSDLTGHLATAAEKDAAGAPPAEVYLSVDLIWEALRARVPAPRPAAPRAAPPRPAAPDVPTTEEA